MATKYDGKCPVDMRTPLVWQIHTLPRDLYLSWVHTPHFFSEEPKVARFFESDFFEFFSRTAWYVVPIVWLPVAAYLMYPAVSTYDPTKVAITLITGLLCWTLMEYSLHRWVFHSDERLPDNGWVRTAHFLLHGVHHKVPMDRYRLVMPPALALIIMVPVVTILRTFMLPPSLMSDDMFWCYFAALLIGYVFYDCFHYAQHHANIDRESYFGRMKRRHMRHHFADQYKTGFGITSPLFDWVFGTEIKLDE